MPAVLKTGEIRESQGIGDDLEKLGKVKKSVRKVGVFLTHL